MSEKNEPALQLIEQTIPGVEKAVKWKSPFYGRQRDSWFLSYQCFKTYVKVTFFRGASLDPVPSGASKHSEVRYLNIRENEFDAAHFVGWVKQPSLLPGEKL